MSVSVDKREVRIRRMFGQIAPWYDFLNHLLSLNIDRRWRRKVTKLVPPGPSSDGPMLDLCTGTGDLALAYDAVSDGKLDIIAADFTHEMLAIGQKKSEKRGRQERITFLEADAQELPFEANQFQLVTVSFGLRNIADTNRGLAEMVRVVKPGGRVAILEFSKPRGKFFGPLYRFYFAKVLPRVGQLFSKSPESAYNYLPASVMSFPDYEQLTEMMANQGLKDCHYYPFTLGIATLYVGTKS
ncbi:MAG: bifunctional demethylmenaquinone methyltransferase/2-methoxy-6-polyprenyl-1,4-benzoquinol methylase UbiE [Fimbriiglobus sp.]